MKLSVNLFENKEVEEKEVLNGVTVQEKNYTFPTDARLHKKIKEGCCITGYLGRRETAITRSIAFMHRR